MGKPEVQQDAADCDTEAASMNRRKNIHGLSRKSQMRLSAKIAAMPSAAFMQHYEFEPDFIVSVGVGTAPERIAWPWLYPDATLIGIDPRPKRNWPGEYVQAAISTSKEQFVPFSSKSQSMYADTPDTVAKTITMDEVAKIFQIVGKVFLWMDCECCEYDVLESGPQLLKNTDWINCEIADLGHDCVCGERLHEAILAIGFQFVYRHQDSYDRLYHRI